MYKLHTRLALLLLISFVLGVHNAAYANLVKGIYLTQSTLENTPYLSYLIKHSKAVGITTFIVDLEIQSKKYQKNINLIKNSGIEYVARVVIFPEGGTHAQITSPEYWEKRYRLIKAAVAYGAQQIQIDYIRYNSKQPASPENSKNVAKVVQWFKDKLEPQGIPLQADVFGIASFGESKHIGQHLPLLAQSVDALCPMVYPSHFEPYKLHAVTPYQTIFKSLKAIQAQFKNKIPVKLYAYIELSNYRYPLSGEQRKKYIMAQIKAVKDAGADGWFAWSAHNKYDYLFNVLGAANIDNIGAASKTIQADATTSQDKTATKPLNVSLAQPNNRLLLPWPESARFFVY